MTYLPRFLRLLFGGLVAGLVLFPANPRPVAAQPNRAGTDFDQKERGYVGPDLVPPPPRPWENASTDASGPWVVRERGFRGRTDLRSAVPGGFLVGKTIYLSPGHGYTWYGSDWDTQRPNSLGLVEDFSNIEGVSQFLIPYLWGAGAHVAPVREVDMNAQSVLLDDADGASHPEAGVVEEIGDPALFASSSFPSFGRFSGPLTDGVNPFQLGTSREVTTSSSPTAQIRYVFRVPEDGTYNVYISYRSSSAAVSDAHAIVRHAGGDAHFRVDQRHHGGTWVLLGRFFFKKGMHPDWGALIWENDSADTSAGAVVSADAVRIGGGVGLFDRGGGPSGWPRHLENCRYNAQFSGAPPSVWSTTGDDHTDDVGTRSRMAAWVHETAEDALYVSWHSNAGGGQGTSVYVYWPDAHAFCDGTDATPGSRELADFIVDEIVGDIREEWDPDWTDRGRRCAWFGELNPSNNGEMPSALIETAFHDHPDDVLALKEPRFRRVVARAIYQAIVRYYAGRDGTSPIFLPEPPEGPCARNAGVGQVEVSWSPPTSSVAGGDPPTGYILYQSADGLAFDEGMDIGADTSTTLNELADGEVRFFRVAAYNDGGVSLPSSVVGTKASPTGRAPLLIVGAFDRLDGRMLWAQDTGTYLGVVDRMVLSRMHDPAAAREHGLAASRHGVSFDSCHHWAAMALPLEDYDAVDYFSGRGASENSSIDPVMRDRFQTYASTGGNLLFNGSHLASHLRSGTTADGDFLEQVGLVAGVATGGQFVVPEGGGILDGVGTFALRRGNQGGYDVGVPDAVQGLSGAVGVASYSSGGSAALHSANGPPGASVFLGFPLDGIEDETQRDEVMGRVLDFFAVGPEPDGGVEAGVEDAGPDVVEIDARDAFVPDAGAAEAGDAEPAPEAGLPEEDGGCGCVVPGGARTARKPWWLLSGMISR